MIYCISNKEKTLFLIKTDPYHSKVTASAIGMSASHHGSCMSSDGFIHSEAECSRITKSRDAAVQRYAAMVMEKSG